MDAVESMAMRAGTRIYNKANQEKAVRIAAKRREHIAVIAAGAPAEQEAADD